MANIPGANNVLPGVFTDVITQSRGVAVPGGSRLVAIIGEGATPETIITQAVGGGADGWNPTYTSNTSGADGRHFKTVNYPIVSNRTTLFRNGVALDGLESVIDGYPFSYAYDYRIDISTGKIELQTAHFVDQNGQDYSAGVSNVGDGYLDGLTLLDVNAPQEIWTVRCVSVQRDALQNPIAGTAKFLAFGSVSGSKVDGYGNPIVWTADGYTVSNGILSFAIYETGPVFRSGDTFIIQVESGVLSRNDSLTIEYIPTSFVNDPVLLQGMADVVARHGYPSTSNTLALGCQLLFANNAPAVITVQAKPAMPRRTSYILSEGVDGTSVNDNDFIFSLPSGVTPDFNSTIQFFITDNVTNEETQVLPNKLNFYTLGDPGYPSVSSFINDSTPAPGGYSYFYTVIEQLGIQKIVINKNVIPQTGLSYGLRVRIIDYRDASFYDAGWLDALKSLETVECDILVPLPKETISLVFQNSLNHCKTMSNIRNKKERVLFIGAITGLTPDNLTGAKLAAVEDIGILEGIQGDDPNEILTGEDLANYSVASAYGNTYRCVYFYPDQIIVQAGTSNVAVDGFYIAAAAAGYLSADTRVENPLTNKVLSGFTILRNKQYSTLTLESLASAGVTTLQPVSGGGRVIWGITTTQSGFPEEQEISIIFIRDRLAKSLRAGFAGFIGLPETPDTEAVLHTRAYILLNAFVSQGLITNFADLVVKRDDVDPRQWNISVRVQPTYPVNFIYIKIAVGQV